MRIFFLTYSWFRGGGVMPKDRGATAASSPKDSGASPPMDFERLRLVAATDDDRKALLALFFRLAKELVAAMEDARHEDAPLSWRDAAHSLKGSAANLGMDALESLCLRAEKNEEASGEERDAMLRAIQDELRAVAAYATRHIPSLPDPGV